MKKPVRYRDVLAMLKAMARDERLSSDGIRVVLAGNLGDEAYTQADIQRTQALAAELGWDLTTDLLPSAPDTTFDTPERYQEEIRRLHAALRTVRAELKTVEHNLAFSYEKSNATSTKRHAQMKAAGVVSVDEAFARLEQFSAYIASLFPCHDSDCGDDPALDVDARIAYIEVHRGICTCGADEVYALATRNNEPPAADAANPVEGVPTT